MAKTLQEILALCQEKEIQMIDFKMTDIDGRWRHLSIPVGRLNEDTMQYGIGFDGSNYGYAPIERSDMVFVPDLDTAAVDPFGEVPTLTMIGDVMIIDRPANRPFDQYPRNVAKRSIDYMKELGIADEMIVDRSTNSMSLIAWSTLPGRRFRVPGGHPSSPVEHGEQRVSSPPESRVPHYATARCHPGSPEPDLHAVGGLGDPSQVPPP